MGADLYINKLEGFRTDDNVGYFRDAYNDSSVLNKLGLSWWQDVAPMRGDGGDMSVEKAKSFLELIKSKKSVLLSNIEGESKENKNWFQNHYNELKSFLEKAIKLKSSIGCSL